VREMPVKPIDLIVISAFICLCIVILSIRIELLANRVGKLEDKRP